MKMYRYLKPAMIAATLAVALPAAAQTGLRYEEYNGNDVRDDYARVVKVDAIVNHASRPVSRETCWEQPTTYQYRPAYTYYRDNDDDEGPDAVTVQGDYRKISDGGARCRTETDWRSTDRVLGYEVTYRYNGREYTTRMDHDPGERMRVRVNYDYTITPEG
jgi:uncharacterized protein YcfJ